MNRNQGNLLTLTQKSKVEANLKKEPLVKKAAKIESKNGDIKVKEIEKQPFYLSKKIGNKIILSFASVFATLFSDLAPERPSGLQTAPRHPSKVPAGI